MNRKNSNKITPRTVIKWLQRFPKSKRFVYTNSFEPGGQMCLFSLFARHYFADKRAYSCTGGDIRLAGGPRLMGVRISFHDEFWGKFPIRHFSISRAAAIEALQQIETESKPIEL